MSASEVESGVTEKPPGVSAGAEPEGAVTMPSILGTDVTVVGDLQSQGPLQIEGRVEGDVNSPMVTIGKNAQVDGSVTGDQVRILGAVAGWVRAKKVSIGDNGRVDGSIQHEELIDESAPAGRPGRYRRMLSQSLTDRQRWLLIRNLSLAVVLLLSVYFVGHSGGWSLVRDLPGFLMPVLGDQNMVALLGFGFLLLLGYAWARAETAADASLRRRLILLERQLGQLRASQVRTSNGKASKGVEPGHLAEMEGRLQSVERRLVALGEEAAAQTTGLRVKSAPRPRHRPPPQRSAGS